MNQQKVIIAHKCDVDTIVHAIVFLKSLFIDPDINAASSMLVMTQDNSLLNNQSGLLLEQNSNMNTTLATESFPKNSETIEKIAQEVSVALPISESSY